MEHGHEDPQKSGGNLTTKLLRLESNWIFRLGTIILEGINSHFELKPFLTSLNMLILNIKVYIVFYRTHLNILIHL
ncbi:hypothetical protein XELAEV_18040519mg [Xenopus laevis]|uniref:Uncharacterized protein n=1 Tax=Xenopus laevis TaxID=8355 RepID=A0A974C9S1_XENLA|nr:hypothetical protein XELAEV_18040519mg [Xenopus laevis]